MKMNSLKTFAAAALAVLAFGCAKENVADEGEKSQVTFTVDVPEATVTTRGLSDAATTDQLICQVFLNDGNYTPVPELTQTVTVENRKATVNFTLVKGNKYAFIFWAQASGTGYYNTEDLRSVKMNVANVKANEPKMDAFWATETLTATANPSTKSKTLYRALAQVNFGSKMPDRSDALAVTESSITMKGVADIFHPFLGNKSTACEGSVDITFAKNATITDEKLKVSEEEYDYLSTAYVFASKQDQSLTDVSATFKFENGKETSVSAPNAPIQGNYRTNIIGDLLTVGSTWTITIDSEFKGGDKIYDAVSANLEKGGNVTLSEDYSVASKSAGVTIPLGVTSTLNLNGKKFSNVNGHTANKAALQVRGNLTIEGNGEVYCEGVATNNAIIVENGGNLTINGGTYNVGKAANGTSNATIYVQGPDTYSRNGTVVINGGTFKAEEGSDGTRFVLNQSDDITTSCFTVKGGTFIGFNPANVNEAHGAITSFVAEGYKSVKVSDSPETWEVQDASVSAATQEEFTSVVAEAGAKVVLAAGTYSAPSTIADGVIIEGVAGTVIDIPAAVAYHDKNIKFKSLTVKSPNANYTGIQHAASVKYEDCTIEGQPFSYATEAVYENCKFVQTSNDAYNIWTYGSKNITFNNCEFNCAGKAVLIYNEGALATSKVTLNNCNFKASEKVTGKAAIEIDQTFTAYEVYINGCSATGFDAGSKSGVTLWNNKKGVAGKSLKVVVDGVEQTL
jgi:hypothetical protein